MPYFTPPGGAETAAFAHELQTGGMGYYLPQARRTLNGMGTLTRFNRAASRGIYRIPFSNASPAGTLGQESDLTVDPTLLLAGIGILAAAMFLFGRKHPKKHRRRHRARGPRFSFL